MGNAIRANLKVAPTQTKYLPYRLGINCIKDENVFFAGDQVITRSTEKSILEDIELPTNDFRLDIDPQIRLDEAFEGIMELINLSPEVGEILVAHVISGIIRAAFVKSGFIPRTVLVIVGESGIRECVQEFPGLSEHTIRKLVAQNRVRHIRTGEGRRGKILIPKAAMLEYLKISA